MTHFKLSFLFSTALACTLAACGSDDSGDDSSDDDSASASGGSNGATTTNVTNSGSGGSGGSSSGGSSSGGSSSGTTTGSDGSNACNPGVGGGSGGSEECADLGECVQRECQSEYEECWGPDFTSGDFSGGTCESYLDCASTCQSGDECDTACVLECLGNISSACQACLTAAGECGADACPDEYEACNGAPTTTTSTTGGGDGTCMDLEACCNSLDGQAQESCLSGLEAVEQAGDQGCALVLASYQSAGEC
ncbi:MAG TPA: hypothetical protein VFU02_20405 [Polyangiaceae bacterium]|nr:hypothetical protein [Polyangiaceae bacterium]